MVIQTILAQHRHRWHMEGVEMPILGPVSVLGRADNCVRSALGVLGPAGDRRLHNVHAPAWHALEAVFYEVSSSRTSWRSMPSARR